MELWALGHSNRPYEAFLKMLHDHSIELVVDVRTVPRSRAVPWADGRALERSLREAGIGYVQMKSLGGLRKPKPDSRNAAWKNASFRGYADHMQTEEFRSGLAELLAAAAKKRTAFLCTEAVPWRCHRSLIADAVLAAGHSVTQLMSPGQSRPHRPTPFAVFHPDGRVTYPATPTPA